LGRALPVRRSPVLVLGMPRSGTTWIGRTLGEAPNALYFNEPVSEVHVAEQGRATFFEVDPSAAPASYEWPLRFAAAGVPAFGPRTVGDGFGLFSRLGKRVVIKEVNPLAIEWYAAALSPTFVYVLRHPAAVAVSLDERGWGWPMYEQRFPLSAASLPVVPETFWARIGAIQGIALARAGQVALAALVEYETVCRDPEPVFRDLYDICGLRWTDAVAASLRASTSGEITRGADDPSGTVRNTAAMADAWRARITPSQLADVRAGWEATNPSRYRDDTDWTLF
jgi:Sulfotransferase domain